MTCSARLPVYTLLIAAFVPAARRARPDRPAGPGAARPVSARRARGDRGGRRAATHRVAGRGLPFVLELPSYRMPALRLWLSPGLRQRVGLSASARARSSSASRSVLWVLLHLPAREPPPGLSEPRARPRYALEHSVAGRIGPRDRAGDRAARLRLEDRRRPGREPRGPRGDRLDARPRSTRRPTRTPRCARPIRRDVDPRHRAAGLHAGHGRSAAGLLRLRAAVHVDARGHAPRDELAGAGPPSPSATLLGDRLRGELRHAPPGERTRLSAATAPAPGDVPCRRQSRRRLARLRAHQTSAPSAAASEPLASGVGIASTMKSAPSPPSISPHR